MFVGFRRLQGLASSSGRRRPYHSSSSSSSSSSSRLPPARLRLAPPLRSSQQEQPGLKQALQEQLQQAVAAEDYVAATKLKEELLELELKDPLYGLRIALDAAVQEERYQDAARLRDMVKEIEDLNKPQPPDMTGVTTSSDTLTQGVRVRVRSYYVPAQSRPELGQFFFAYSVTVTNEGDKTVQLSSRHWVITDGTGKVDHVRGPGVVGEQPRLEPGQSFEYQSACPLFTTVGTMEGEYEMAVMDAQGEWVDKLEVKIGKFALRKPEME
eukprot:GHRQ01003539.1.p1 GENE.GHRQ01003539.1~~GHRQ01003539.1.p1  ORF type:complete len:269 (+),score=123.32 GHRQ01003539.1:152-958(+)